ncbi:MAG TPA: hypothetical protein VFX59_12155, partial [Polyangiales bacterium]|nr:hypothetical protein [Polyangiales bacterium]
LEEIGKLTGLALALEVSEPAHVDRAARRADLLIVPSVHMHNDALLHEVGRLDRPLLLERSSTASIDEWLAAADRILARGNHRVALCERGIRTFEHTTLDLAAVPLLREHSHLPVLVDPTRGSARSTWIALAEGARAAGAHGLSLAAQLGQEPGLSLEEITGLIAKLSQG